MGTVTHTWLALLAVTLGIAPTAQSGSSCVGLAPPVIAPIVASYAPIGSYAGHWGIDYATPVGTTVMAAGSGVVTFAGSVAGNSTVSIEHGGGLKTSYSFLMERAVVRGDWVERGEMVGSSGEHDGRPALHLSVRVDGVYVDPLSYVGCRAAVPGDALRLVPVP